MINEDTRAFTIALMLFYYVLRSEVVVKLSDSDQRGRARLEPGIRKVNAAIQPASGFANGWFVRHSHSR